MLGCVAAFQGGGYSVATLSGLVIAFQTITHLGHALKSQMSGLLAPQTVVQPDALLAR